MATDKKTMDALGIREGYDFQERAPKTHGELMLAEMKEHTRLFQSMERKLSTIATAAAVFLILFILSAVFFFVTLFGGTAGKL